MVPPPFSGAAPGGTSGVTRWAFCTATSALLATGCATKQTVAQPAVPVPPVASPRVARPVPSARTSHERRRSATASVRTESPPPLLGELMSAEQRGELLRDIQSALDRARKNIAAIE